MKLFWLDLETTGLDPEECEILEVAVSAADFETPFDARPVYHGVVRYRVGHRNELHPYVLDMHTQNGLLEECSYSELSLHAAEQALLSIVPFVESAEDMPVLAGSSVHFDHRFLREHMPTLALRFSHRFYDVSAVKLFCRSLGMPKIQKAEAHRAVADVAESIEHARQCAAWIGTPHGATSRG